MNQSPLSIALHGRLVPFQCQECRQDSMPLLKPSESLKAHLPRREVGPKSRVLLPAPGLQESLEEPLCVWPVQLCQGQREQRTFGVGGPTPCPTGSPPALLRCLALTALPPPHSRGPAALVTPCLMKLRPPHPDPLHLHPLQTTDKPMP